MIVGLVDKEFGSDDKMGKEAQIWQNREIDWYNAERRFIFSSLSIMES